MRVRTALISLACAAGLLLSGCSGGIPGVPEIAGGAGTGAASGAAPPVTGSAPSSVAAGGSSAAGGDGGSSAAGGDGGSSAAGGDGGSTGLPPASETAPSLPTDGIGTLPTDLGSVPGLDPACLTVAGILMGVSTLFLAPTLGGQPLTKQQVDQAFADMGQVPPALDQPVKVLHEAALQAVGKSSTQAAAIVGSDQVKQALDALSKYTDSTCGGS